MIPPIQWGRRFSMRNELSPFDPKRNEPVFDDFESSEKESNSLRITFDTESFRYADDNSKAALDAIRDLADLDDIDLVGTQLEIDGQLCVPGYDPAATNLTVTVTRDQRIGFPILIANPADLLITAATGTGNPMLEHPDNYRIAKQLLIGRAHEVAGRDILVTCSRDLLDQPTNDHSRFANSMSPTEAARVVGLLLRSREISCIYATRGFRKQLENSSFYFLLMRGKTPKLWRWFSACVLSERLRKDGIQDLGEAVLTRIKRVYRTRDEIGKRFYRTHARSFDDDMNYYFDYLMLLLQGTFDAMARVANRCYEVHDLPGERSKVSFRHNRFRRELSNSGAGILSNLVATKTNQALFGVLSGMRNTIHGSNLRGVVHQRSDGNRLLIELSEREANELRPQLEQLGALDDMGVEIQSFSDTADLISIEPFTFSTFLIEMSIHLVNHIAEKTDIERLFPPESPPESLSDGPPDNMVFRDTERVLLLG